MFSFSHVSFTQLDSEKNHENIERRKEIGYWKQIILRIKDHYVVISHFSIGLNYTDKLNSDNFSVSD